MYISEWGTQDEVCPFPSTCRNSCPLWGMTSYGMNQKDFLPLRCKDALSICRSESSEYQPNLDSCHYVYSRSLGPWHVLGLSMHSPHLPAPLGLLGFCVDTLLEKAKELGWLDPQQFIISDFLWIFSITHCAFCHSLAIDPLTQSSIQ